MCMRLQVRVLKIVNLRHGNLGLLEPDLSKKYSSNSTAERVAGHELLHATADERSGVICLLEVPESGPDGDVRTGRVTTAGESTGITGSLERYVSETSLLNSDNSSMCVACVGSAPSCCCPPCFCFLISLSICCSCC